MINLTPIRKKKAQVSIYIFFMFVAFLIIVIGAVLAPMGVLFNTELYKAGEMILNNSLDSINGIQDVTVRTQINNTVYTAMSSAQDQIEVNSDIFQYSWLLILGLTALIVFLYSRRLVEISGGGGFV